MQKAVWRRMRNFTLAVATLVAISHGVAQADVKLPNVFGDHMVLQQGQKNKVWGLADAGESVTVSIDTQSHKVAAGADGKWHVMLDPLPVGGPYELKVAGKNEVKLTDVLVGEVWVCSGQSNMVLEVKRSLNSRSEILNAANDRIRMLTVQLENSLVPLENLKTNLAEQGYDIEKIPFVIQYNKRDLPNAADLAELRRLMNPKGTNDFEATATNGVGVFDTLKAIAKLVLTELKKGG